MGAAALGGSGRVRTAGLRATVPVVLGLAIAAAYANGLHLGFHFDDRHVVETNAAIRSLANLPAFFVDADLSTASPDNRTLRPLLLASYALNWAVSGADPWSWHAVNLCLHWLAVVLVFRIVRDHLWLGAAAVPVAAVAALVVAVHPLNTSAVNYVAARSAVLQAVFYLGAFDLAARRRFAGSLGCLAAALLTKEIAFTLPFVVLAWWRLAGERPAWGWVAAAALLAAAALGYRWLLLPPGVIAATHAADVTPWTYCMTGWSAYLHYLRLFLWPDALAIDRLDFPIVRSLAAPRAWLSLGALVALGGAAWSVRRRRPAVAFAAAWIFLTLAAESTVFPLAEPVNEHRPYLAMLGFGTLAALALDRLAGLAAACVRRPPAAVFAALAVVAAASLATATHVRNRVWQSDYALWLDAVAKAPANPRARTNAGLAAMSLGRLDEARDLLLAGHRLAPCYAYALMNLSVLERRAGNRAAAIRWADDAVRCHPTMALAHFYRGAALAWSGRDDDALAAWARATALDPRHADAWAAQARMLERRDPRAAVHAWDRAFAADPTRVEAGMNAGLLYAYALHDPAQAVERFRGVLRALPSHYGAHYQLAVALLKAGRTDEAHAAWRAFVPLAAAIGDRKSLDEAPAALRVAAR